MNIGREYLLPIGDEERAILIYTGKRWFYNFASCPFECILDADPKKEQLVDLRKIGVDLFTFVQRVFLSDSAKKSYLHHKEIENYAIMEIDSYDDWWSRTIKKRERQSVRKAERTGVIVRKTEINEDFLKGVQKIYNETPFREGRRYSGYGQSIQALKRKFEKIGDSDILGAYLKEELIGILWITYGDRAAMFRSFVSLLKHRDKCPNNALISEAVRKCAERRIRFLLYGDHYGFIPSLDRFREHQGFRRFPLPRYYVPLTAAGQVALKLRVHKKIEYSMPIQMEQALLKVYSSVSRMVPSAVWYQLGEE